MNRKGFTLIELLIVVVIIGILAAIAIPKFASTKQKAYLASMKSDLRNLTTAQEAYFSDSLKYAAGTPSNVAGTVVGFPAGCLVGTSCLFVPSAGVTVTVTATATPAEWQATASHVAATSGTVCAIFIGATTKSPATVEGEPRCQ